MNADHASSAERLPVEYANLVSIKSEILFFMEKIFQFSFLYIGALFAVASGKLDLGKALADALGVTPQYLALNVFLLLNLVYLIFSCSCIFATLKRGYFILENYSNSKDPLVQWEKSTRNNPEKFRRIYWSIDNSYVACLFSIVALGSLCAFVWACIQYDYICIILPLTLLILHGIPFMAVKATLQLLKETRKLLRKQESGR